jgi:two-component system invasion response regulator UvrY
MHTVQSKPEVRPPYSPDLESSQSALRVLLADDHAVLRRGLKELLIEDHADCVVGEAGTGYDTLRMLRQGKWDILILDINMPDRSGIDILGEIHSLYPDLKVLILSGLPERQYALNVLRNGARGYLNKEMSPEDLLSAIKTVLSGKRYVSEALADLLVTELESDSNKPAHSKLSEREFQVFCKLATGRTVSAIGAELSLAVKTISTYRARVMEKMGFSSNADITAYALRNKLVE